MLGRVVRDTSKYVPFLISPSRRSADRALKLTRLRVCRVCCVWCREYV
jgi:hypothetical protein